MYINDRVLYRIFSGVLANRWDRPLQKIQDNQAVNL